MSDRPLLEQLAWRNPVPQPADPPSDAWDLATVRHELMRRETAMDSMERAPTARPSGDPPSRGGWLIAAAAFAVVIIVGLVAFFGGGDDGVTPTTVAAVDSTTEAPTPTTQATPPPTTEVTQPPTTTRAVDLIAEADALMTAIYTNDLAAIAAMASPRADLEFVTYFAGFVQAIDEFANGEIAGWTCEATAASNVVRCHVDYVDDTVRAAGFEQLTESWDIGFAIDGAHSMGYSPSEDDVLAGAIGDMMDSRPEVFESGGPCEGFFADGDPSECVRALLEFVADSSAENG